MPRIRKQKDGTYRVNGKTYKSLATAKRYSVQAAVARAETKGRRAQKAEGDVRREAERLAASATGIAAGADYYSRKAKGKTKRSLKEAAASLKKEAEKTRKRAAAAKQREEKARRSRPPKRLAREALTGEAMKHYADKKKRKAQAKRKKKRKGAK